jgi:hypothetical protein
MIDLSCGSTICLQQTLSTGADGTTPTGYARYSYATGSPRFAVRWRQFGAAGNAQKVQLVDTGAGTVVGKTYASYDPTAKTLVVFLRRTAGALAATASEVCAVVNALKDRDGQPYGYTADASVDGVVAAVAATALAGGLDPVDVGGGLYKWSTTSGGVFYFDQKTPWIIRTIEGRFPSAASGFKVDVRIANVDKALNVVSGEDILIYSNTNTNASGPYGEVVIAGIETPVLPGQAITVTTTPALPGVLRCNARPEAARSYL